MKRLVLFCVALIVVYVLGTVLVNLPQKKSSIANSPAFNQPTPTGESTSTNLKSEDLKVGTGTEAKTGDTVKVNYVGTLTNGTKFDSSYDRNEPYTFTLGNGEVIKGWDEGVAGMKIGGKRRLTIPPELGYGDQPQGKIPANSTLIFEVELLDVSSGATQQFQPNINL